MALRPASFRQRPVVVQGRQGERLYGSGARRAAQRNVIEQSLEEGKREATRDRVLRPSWPI
ncbi:MAG: hypothetical protein GX649_17470 [Chloroflexi bacterium]|nr:hypothetical protein [Chloroflexota bacterium]